MKTLVVTVLLAVWMILMVLLLYYLGDRLFDQPLS